MSANPKSDVEGTAVRVRCSAGHSSLGQRTRLTPTAPSYSTSCCLLSTQISHPRCPLRLYKSCPAYGNNPNPRVQDIARCVDPSKCKPSTYLQKDSTARCCRSNYMTLNTSLSDLESEPEETCLLVSLSGMHTSTSSQHTHQGMFVHVGTGLDKQCASTAWRTPSIGATHTQGLLGGATE